MVGLGLPQPSLAHALTQPWTAKCHPSPYVSCHHPPHPCGPGPSLPPRVQPQVPLWEKKGCPKQKKCRGALFSSLCLPLS